MGMQVVAHTSFLGHTGYNNHSRNFFTHLNKNIPVRVRNYTYTKDLTYLRPEERALLIEQKWTDPPHKIGTPFKPNPNDTIVNIVLNESHHYYFYDQYDSPMIAYNVWEATKQIPEYFNRILQYDQFWCPTAWQRQCTIDQGYPSDRVKVVPEAVNGNIFRPIINEDEDRKLLYEKYGIPEDTFTFIIFGRWDYRKSITELIQAFNQEFKDTDNVMLVASVDNPFSVDGLNTTEERMKHYGLENDKIKILHFPDRPDYVRWMQLGNAYLSCSRSEGWNLPLMEAIASGTPAICSGWGAQLEFANDIAHTVNIAKLQKPKNVFMMDEKEDIGFWSEPDFDHLQHVMRKVYEDYDINKSKSIQASKAFREKWSWENAALIAHEHIEQLCKSKSYVVSDNGVELYQDQYVNGDIIKDGIRDCDFRYKALKQVFDKYKRPFTILDIGANFGYYSLRAATEYGATSVMVESEDGEVKTLLNLCEQNDCRDNLTVLQTRMNLHKLKEISKCEHFDVVLALNIIHHFKSEEVAEVCEVFRELGDNLILETPPIEDHGACGQENLTEILDYFGNIEGMILGEFERHTSKTHSAIVWFETSKSILEWPYYEYEKLFERKDIDVDGLKNRGVDGAKSIVESDFNSKKIRNPRKKELLDWIPGINLHTFINLNGIYPNVYNLIHNLETRNVLGDYKWDDSNKDIMSHNFILNGSNLHMIDYDDNLIGSGAPNDQLQLELTINEIKKCYSYIDKPEEEKIKINLGCGNDIKPGYINIDRYNNTGRVDMKCDIGDLPFDDKTVDEIFTSHVFEHIGIMDMYGVLTEWRRVLKDNGCLVLYLPDLEHEVNIWVNAPDDKKWLDVHRIFGSQTHPGNTHFCGFNTGSLKSFLEGFNFQVEDIGIGDRGMGHEIQCTAIKLADDKIMPVSYACHFVDGPIIDIQGDPNDKGYYAIDFLDPDNDASVHQTTLSINTWTRPFRKYFTNWLVKVRRNGVQTFEHKFDLKGKNVLINFDTKSIGDTLAWIPYTDLFRQKHECNVIVSTFHNNLFKGHPTYKHLKFIEPGSREENLYASYSVGCYDEDLNKNLVNWRTVPLQRVCSDTLGLQYNEIIPDLAITPGDRPIKEKYVTISEWSTFQCKHWNYEGGWQQIIDWFNDNGYKVMVISKEDTNLKNVISRTNRPIEHTITNIYHGEMHLGVSAGPSWIAWALRKPVVMISGYSHAFGEFTTNIERIINEDVCHGCFNDTDNVFDRGDWRWCPRQKETPRQFECTKTITPERVIKSIENILPMST